MIGIGLELPQRAIGGHSSQKLNCPFILPLLSRAKPSRAAPHCRLAKVFKATRGGFATPKLFIFCGEARPQLRPFGLRTESRARLAQVLRFAPQGDRDLGAFSGRPDSPLARRESNESRQGRRCA